MVQHRWPRSGGGGTKIPAYRHHLLWLFTVWPRHRGIWGGENFRMWMIGCVRYARLYHHKVCLPVSKQSEDELFRLAHARGVNGIARLYSSCVRLVSQGIRQRPCDQKAHQDQELRIQVMGLCCVPLY